MIFDSFLLALPYFLFYLRNTFSVLVLFFGCVAIAIAYLTSQLGAILQTAASVVGIIGGPLVGLYTLGVLFPFANSKVRLKAF